MFKKKLMYEYNLEIHGMRCGMCESHINDVIRRNFNIKKVKSSHLKNNTTILSLEKLDEDKIYEVIKETGYELVNIQVSEILK